MAPRGGRGGSSSSGGGVSACPDAFTTPIEQASFALDVVFFVIYLGILIAIFSIRKKGSAGKRLIGLPFIGAVFFFTLSALCSFVAELLYRCDVTDGYSYVNWFVAIVIFRFLALWLLLMVVVFTLNTMLQKQLGRSKSIFKIILLAIIGVMGLLTAACAGLTAYLNYARPRSYTFYDDDLLLLALALVKLRTAYYALYLVSLVASGGMALATTLSLRKEKKAAASLIGWVVSLTVAMLLWVAIALVFSSWALTGSVLYVSEDSSMAMTYIQNFSQALACIIILCIAKQAAPVPYQQQYANTNNQTYQPQTQYAYSANPNGQTYQYNQAPEFAGTTHPIK